MLQVIKLRLHSFKAVRPTIFLCLILEVIAGSLFGPLFIIASQGRDVSKPTAPRHTQNVEVLEYGNPIERTITGNQSHSYQVKINSGQYARLSVEQRGIDVIVELSAPNGHKLAEVDSPNGALGQEEISVVAATTGNYSLLVRPASSEAPPGKYEIKLTELRATVPSDQKNIAAERIFAEATLLSNQKTEEAIQKAITKYEEASALWAQAVNVKGEAKAIFNIGRLRYDLGLKRQSLEYFNQALARWRSQGDCIGEAQALNEIGAVHNYLDERSKALENFRRALAISRNLKDKAGEAEALHNLGWFYDEVGEPEKSLDYYSKAFAVAEANNDIYEQANSLNNIGKVNFDIGEYSKSLDFYNRALKIRRALNSKKGVAQTLANIAAVYGQIGTNAEEKRKAIPYYEESLAIRRNLNDREGLTVTLNNLAVLYSELGEREKSENARQEALNISKTIDVPSYITRNLSNQDVTGQRIASLSADDKELLRKIFAALNDERDDQKATQLVVGNTEAAKRIAGVLRDIGIMELNSGQFKAALREFIICLHIYTALQETQFVADTFSSVAAVYLNVKNYRRALEFFLRSAELYKNLADKEHERSARINMGKTLYFVSVALYERKDIEGSLKILKEAHKLYKEFAALEDLADTSKLLGFILSENNRLQEALAFYEEARRAFSDLKDKGEEGLVLNNIGRIRIELGDHPRAINDFKEAINISQQVTDKYRSRELIEATANNLGESYNLISDYEKAMSYYQQSLTAVRESCDRPKEKEAALLNNIASIFDQTNDFDAAIEYLDQARAIYINDPQVAQLNRDHELGAILSGLAVAYAKKGESQKAIKYLEESIELRKKGRSALGIAATSLNLGTVYLDVKDYDKALKTIQESIKISKDNGYKLMEGIGLNNLGEIFRVQKKYDQAMETLHKALQISRETENKDLEGGILANIGNLYRDQGKTLDAVAWYEKSLDRHEQVRSRAGTSIFKENFFERHVDLYGDTVALLLELNKPTEAFAYAERSKARSLLDMLNEASAGIRKGVDARLIEEENKLYGKIQTILTALENSNEQEVAQKKMEHRALENQLVALQQRIREANPRLADLKEPRPASISEVQRDILKQDEVLIEYFQAHDELYVFIVGKSNFATHTIELSSSEVTEKVAEFIKPLNRGNPRDFNVKLGHELYRQLFEPLELKIRQVNGGKDVKSLILIPDGATFYLPFEMLVTEISRGEQSAEEGENKFLVSSYPLTYAASASVLKPKLLRAPGAVSQELLALAPFSGGATSSDLAPVADSLRNPLLSVVTEHSRADKLELLPFSKDEVENITTFFPRSDSKYNKQATKAYFEEHSKTARYLHLATHGYLNSAHPMYSGISFSDGMLRTYEIFNLNINAELVVLSACETGLGGLKRGEGIIGLSRAFLYAGTPSLIVSLWKVADPSTAKLMKIFYRNLDGGMTKAEALKEAKLWMIKNSYHTDDNGNVIKHDNPYYWAPFILIGKN